MSNYKRIVVKVGTNLITDDKGWLNHAIIESLVAQLVELKNRAIEVILVSSGSMGAGRSLLNLPANVGDVVRRQVLSSLGQVKLIEAYSIQLAKHAMLCCQILVCKQDFRDRHHYLNMKNCFTALLQDQILPVVNENDAIAIDELMFTDNDELAGLIASMMRADALVILTNVDGLLTGHPSTPDATLISSVDISKDKIGHYIAENKSVFGRGGMHTKCRVAANLASLGVTTHIANGTTESVLVRLCDGEILGTTFVPTKKVSSIKKWISSADGQEKGTVWINACAEDVLTDSTRVSSLLPIGIIKIAGTFSKGDLIKVQAEDDRSLGIGIARYGADKARSDMGQRGKRALIHYDYLYLKDMA
ncbi:Glutamate 5-kinase [Chlamydiales bacterium SCGC AG-110-P3]|nr:Glutamate 5-kinase [Chlamydiales bacterium SCGC AG-110-P3]